MLFYIVLILTIGIAYPFLKLKFKKKESYKNKHVIIVGGSTGIGKSLAEEYIKDGAKVSIIARNQKRLEDAKASLEGLCEEKSQVEIYSSDASKSKAISETLQGIIKSNDGKVDHVVYAAGYAKPKYFLDADVEDFENCMKVNYFGCVYTLKTMLPHFVKQGHGKVIVISSAIAFSTFIGYSSYSPTKCALHSLVCSLRNEYSGCKNINFHINYPPDTQTPGFDQENKSKPQETKDANEGTIFKSEDVATKIFSSVKNGYFVTTNPDPIIDLLAIVGEPFVGRWSVLEIVLAPLVLILTKIGGIDQDKKAAPYGKRLLRQ